MCCRRQELASTELNELRSQIAQEIFKDRVKFEPDPLKSNVVVRANKMEVLVDPEAAADAAESTATPATNSKSDHRSKADAELVDEEMTFDEPSLPRFLSFEELSKPAASADVDPSGMLFGVFITAATWLAKVAVVWSVMFQLHRRWMLQQQLRLPRTKTTCKW